MARVAAAEVLRPGTRVGPYVVAETLGRGSQATVYMARDANDEPVALKVRRRGVESLDRRFLREFESMRTLRLPGVVRVHEAGLHEDLLWFSMDVVFGRHVLEVIHSDESIQGRVQATIELGTRLMEILHGVHQAGYIHRDIKPSNILVDRHGKLHVLDFGVVRYFSDSDTLSHSGEILGTVPYMAPEQIAGLPMDNTIDLFAAGLLLYEAVAGPRPRPLTTVGWIPRICLERLQPLATRFREVPLALSSLVEQLTSALPHERPDAHRSATRLHAMSRGADLPQWPQPDFVEPGEWLHELDSALPGPRRTGRTWVLEGPAGSGRGRTAEHLHRQAVLQGVWPVHTRCRSDAPGLPLRQLLQAILGSAEDEEALAHLAGSEATVLHRAWPELPLPAGSAISGPQPDHEALTKATLAVVSRAAEHRPVMLVVRRLELVDTLSARGLMLLASQRHLSLGLLLLHDRRWQTRLSHELVAGLDGRYRARVIQLGPVSASVAQRMAASLCPEEPPEEAPEGLPLDAVRVGLQALCAWRGAPWEEPGPELWPLAVRDAPLPEEVLVRLVGASVMEQPWVQDEEHGLVLTDAWARTTTWARMDDLRSAARAVADAWTLFAGGGAPMADIASLRLLGEEYAAAWLPAAHAALQAASRGLHVEARRWLLLLDSLPTDRVSAGHLAFDLAAARARVAMDTQIGVPDLDLVQVAETLAVTPRQQELSQVLRATAELRAGEPRTALVSALRVASRSEDAEVQAQSLITATRCRLALGQLSEAVQQLDRADALLGERQHGVTHVDLANLRIRVLRARHDLLESRKIARATIARASEAGYLRGLAEAASHLSGILRMTGRRRQAETHARAALDAVATTGDMSLAAEASLALATLLAERGDAAGARKLLDDTIRRVRALGLDHLLPWAMRVALQVAVLSADATEATMAMAALDPSDPEVAAVQARWWRIRGDYARIDLVEAPPHRTYGRVLWLCERARAWLAADDAKAATAEARTALSEAMRFGYSELQIYARLILGALTEEEDEAWAQQVRKASDSLFTEVYLGALELDARRLHARGDPRSALPKWRVLRARAQELGYRPGVQEATGWLLELTRS